MNYQELIKNFSESNYKIIFDYFEANINSENNDSWRVISNLNVLIASDKKNKAEWIKGTIDYKEYSLEETKYTYRFLELLNDLVSSDITISESIKDKWRQVLLDGSLTSYQSFLEEYPQSKLTPLAQKKLYELEESSKKNKKEYDLWVQAKKDNSYYGYIGYLRSPLAISFLEDAEAELLNILSSIDKWDDIIFNTFDKNRNQKFADELQSFDSFKLLMSDIHFSDNFYLHLREIFENIRSIHLQYLKSEYDFAGLLPLSKHYVNDKSMSSVLKKQLFKGLSLEFPKHKYDYLAELNRRPLNFSLGVLLYSALILLLIVYLSKIFLIQKYIIADFLIFPIIITYYFLIFRRSIVFINKSRFVERKDLIPYPVRYSSGNLFGNKKIFLIFLSVVLVYSIAFWMVIGWSDYVMLFYLGLLAITYFIFNEISRVVLGSNLEPFLDAPRKTYIVGYLRSDLLDFYDLNHRKISKKRKR